LGGQNCEIDLFCENSPCQNNAPCNNGTCDCLAIKKENVGYFGKFCERQDFCLGSEPVNCTSRGNCVSLQTTHLCQCESGFRGNYCDINIDECEIEPCLHNGKCFDGINNFKCECDEEFWYGDKCQFKINSCENEGDKCKNGSKCVDNYWN